MDDGRRSGAEDVTQDSATRLEDLTPGARMAGVVPGAPVTVVATAWHGGDAVTLTYRGADGRVAEELLDRSTEARLSRLQNQHRWSFDADGADFRLAAEALRLRMAALADPMLAVSTSDIDPLPHQIRAVYEELLPRAPLRFLLADDPGAGKTIMAGLYAKELVLRGDVSRCLVVAPGSLVEQWQEELETKFGLTFELLSRSMVESTTGSVFDAHPLLLARMDQLSRDDDLLADLGRSEWDLVVVDEAHRMSAHYFGIELSTTRRYRLGQLLGDVTRHLLLMTATPHAGKEEDFQLFLSLLDADRFEGRYRSGVHSADTSGLMRRMVKEQLLTFEGKPLFPERVAETVPYTLSDAEQELYEDVTRYVREEMGRADQLRADGDGRRSTTVGFALTVLQRRLASSPEAIWRSLQRRRERLLRRRAEMLDPQLSPVEDRVVGRLSASVVEDLDDLDDLPPDDLETFEDDVVDAATAARTVAELDVEVAVLADLEALAAVVRASGTDRKWSELRGLLTDHALVRDATGERRKLIVFTEHRDTLAYLQARITDLLGDSEAVVSIHGGVRREERRRVRERFTQDPRCQVLVATDAAGEGLNLQAAHLMVNYDLPWNPNRIEQRFGRIHRIGQTEVCRLWNLVAEGTREGQVFTRLLDKVEEQRRAYGGLVFDVLGASFAETPLRDLLLEAIRYGDQPEVRARLDQVVDAEVADGLRELLAERALHASVLGHADVEALRRQMDEARARRMQPHYVELFFREAFTRLGGRLSPREAGRFEVTHVPAALRDRPTRRAGVPVVARYARVTFTPERMTVTGTPRADLLAPGHPLLDAVVEATLEAHGGVLGRGAVLVDLRDAGTVPHLLVALDEEIANGLGDVVGRRFAFVTIGPDGGAALAGPAPYLDAEPLPEHQRHLAERVLAEGWLGGGVDAVAMSWAIAHSAPQHRDEVTTRVTPAVERTREQVRGRLSQQVNFWYAESARLAEDAAAGRRVRTSPERAATLASQLEVRLERRLERLAAEAHLSVRPPRVVGAALVLPAGLLPANTEGAPASTAVDTTVTERRAVDAVLAAERRLGRVPVEMAHNNPGYDVRSLGPDGYDVFIEVKGRVTGAEDYFVTYNEVLTGKNAAPRYRLALVSVSDDGPAHDEVRYLDDPFATTELGGFPATGIRGDWRAAWAQGSPPH
jgi:superfamily II DNA or RNA helicase